MKKILIVIAAMAYVLAVVGCSGSKTYTVKGNVADFEGTVYLIDDTRTILDSAVVNNGAFTFKHEYEVPAIYSISNETMGRGDFNIRFYVEPGVITVAPAEGEGWNVTGTPANDANTAYGAEMRDWNERYKNATRREARNIEKEYDEIVKKYYEANRDNYFGAYLLSRELSYGYSGEELLEAVNSFPENLQEGEYLVKQRKIALQRMKTDPGNSYIDVSQKDPQGNEVLLSSVVENPANKYILVDFWASWCGPCMGEVPYLKATYDMYHDKGFEIYGISLDVTHDKWTSCIEKRGLNWIHVSDLNRFNNQACEDYAIVAIPSNVLLDGEGKVVAKQLFGDDLQAKVAEFLGE